MGLGRQHVRITFMREAPVIIIQTLEFLKIAKILPVKACKTGFKETAIKMSLLICNNGQVINHVREYLTCKSLNNDLS